MTQKLICFQNFYRTMDRIGAEEFQHFEIVHIRYDHTERNGTLWIHREG